MVTLYSVHLSWPYCSNPPFLYFDIRALCRSGVSARVPNDRFGDERFGRLIFATIKKSRRHFWFSSSSTKTLIFIALTYLLVIAIIIVKSVQRLLLMPSSHRRHGQDKTVLSCLVRVGGVKL